MKRSDPSKEPARSTSPRLAASGWARWAGPALCLALTAAATWFLLENIILSKVPRAMLGKWVVVEGDPIGATLEFFADGTLVGNVNRREQDMVLRVRGNSRTLWTTTVNPLTSREETEPQTIVSLTDAELVIEDREGTIIHLERAR